MFFSYTASVLLLSLAIYGLWQLMKDLWKWYTQPSLSSLPSASIVLYVKNAEHIIEDMLRTLFECWDEGNRAQLVLVDGGSEDATLFIAERLCEGKDYVLVLPWPTAESGLWQALALCRGESVHFFDLVHRLKPHQVIPAVQRVLACPSRTLTG